MRPRRSAAKPSSAGAGSAVRTVSAAVIARDHRKGGRPSGRVGSRPVTALERPPDELRALGRLALAELADAVGGIGGVHRAISDRVFRHVGPGATAARVGHDAIATGVYASLCCAMRLAGE